MYCLTGFPQSISASKMTHHVYIRINPLCVHIRDILTDRPTLFSRIYAWQYSILRPQSITNIPRLREPYRNPTPMVMPMQAPDIRTAKKGDASDLIVRLH